MIFGDINRKDIQRLRTASAESNITVTVDLMAYDEIIDELLKAHIDQVGVTLVF